MKSCSASVGQRNIIGIVFDNKNECLSGVIVEHAKVVNVLVRCCTSPGQDREAARSPSIPGRESRARDGVLLTSLHVQLTAALSTISSLLAPET